ncbi:unnamed protein product [Arctia plantaginis]|nr:unnamed protein product [Arctia plantaginis]
MQKRGVQYIYNNVRLCDQHFELGYRTPCRKLTRNAFPTLNIEKGILPAQCEDTSDILLFFDDLFDSLNGSFTGDHIAKPLQGSVTPASPHKAKWTESIQILKSMKFEGKAYVPTIDGTALKRRSSNPPELKKTTEQMQDALKTINTVLTNKSTQKEDMCDMYGKLIASKLKKYFSAIEQQEVMLELDELLTKRIRNSLKQRPTSSLSAMSSTGSFDSTSPAEMHRLSLKHSMFFQIHLYKYHNGHFRLIAIQYLCQSKITYLLKA